MAQEMEREQEGGEEEGYFIGGLGLGAVVFRVTAVKD